MLCFFSLSISWVCSMANISYRLRCQLYGHESDVRSVSTITEYDGILSGSRDKTARIWRPSEYVLLKRLYFSIQSNFPLVKLHLNNVQFYQIIRITLLLHVIFHRVINFLMVSLQQEAMIKKSVFTPLNKAYIYLH